MDGFEPFPSDFYLNLVKFPSVLELNCWKKMKSWVYVSAVMINVMATVAMLSLSSHASTKNNSPVKEFKQTDDTFELTGP
jgi:hypothetical protein